MHMFKSSQKRYGLTFLESVSGGNPMKSVFLLSYDTQKLFYILVMIVSITYGVLYDPALYTYPVYIWRETQGTWLLNFNLETKVNFLKRQGH